MKKIIICLTVLLLTVIGFICFNVFFAKDNVAESNYKTEYLKTNNSSETEEKEDEYITESIESDNNIDENITNDDNSSNKDNMESNNDINSNDIKNKTANEQKQEEQKAEENKIAEIPKQEQPKEQTAWESLGISEYDYYHSPMWSWARVDYSINTYGSIEKTHQACIDAGSNLEDILSFSCTTVNSYSGDYLGDMLKIKY